MEHDMEKNIENLDSFKAAYWNVWGQYPNTGKPNQMDKKMEHETETGSI